MAIKEEAYDPGYEAAFGGAYGEGGPGPEEGQSNGNGHCNFSSAENTGQHRDAWMDHRTRISSN